MKPELLVFVEFLSVDEGGRDTSICLNGRCYRPHLRIIGDIELLGVQFIEGPDRTVKAKERVTATICLLYYPNVSYCNLIKNKEFEILEGARVVGKGKVICSFNK